MVVKKTKQFCLHFFGSEVTNSLGPYLLGSETVISVMYELVQACLLSKQAWTGLNKYRHDHSFFLLLLFSFVLKHFSLLVRFMSKTSEFPIDVLDIQFYFRNAKIIWTWFRQLSVVVKRCFWSSPKSFGFPQMK